MYGNCMSTSRRIDLPADLLDELESSANKVGMGYSTIAEAVKDAIRRRIETLKVAAVNRSVHEHILHEKSTETAETGGAMGC